MPHSTYIAEATARSAAVAASAARKVSIAAVAAANTATPTSSLPAGYTHAVFSDPVMKRATAHCVVDGVGYTYPIGTAVVTHTDIANAIGNYVIQ